jgi:hypothetical protein
MKTKCKYSCSLCGIYRQEVDVQSRQDELITDWMDNVMIPALVADHEVRSPNCHPTKLSEVMIPMMGSNQIGGCAFN